MHAILAALAAVVLVAPAAGCTYLYGSPRAADGHGDGGGAMGDLAGVDGGANLPWSPMVSNTLEALRGIWGCDPADVSAVGTNGTILSSQSFGSWQAQVYGARHFHAISGIDCAHRYAAGAADNIYFATDIASWIPGRAPNASGDLFGVASSGAVVVVVGSGGEVRKGSISASMWIASNSGVTTDLYAVWGVGLSFYAAGANGVLLYSGDSGGSWAPQVSGTNENLRGGWTSRTESDAYVVGDHGVILHSIDKGANWERVESGASVTLRAVWGSGLLDVYVVGSNATVLHSTDGGHTWPVESTPASSDLYAVWGSSASDVYAVGDAGTIVHRP